MSRYEDSDRYDFSRLLDWKKAQVQQGDASGLQPDETYTLNWVIPYGSQEQARNWIYANRQGFQGPEIPFMQLDGFWRTLQVRYQVVDPKNSNAGVNIQHIIAKGYYTGIDWDTARILSEDSSASNDSSAGIPDSESAQEQKFLQVRFPFIAPESVSSIVGSVSVPSPVTIRGNTYTGLNKILEAARLEEDGSYSVLVTLADPQYTLESYSDAGGTNQQDIVYLWDVPKDLAQTLIDNWKSTNPVSASASADYNDSQKLVNIVLRKNSLVKPNLTLAGINVACDTTQNFHFAWGYQKEDIQAFIDAHNSPTGTGSRQVQVQSRADGLYDITIIETVVSADNPPHFDITLGVGDKITNTQKYGWNISKAQLSSIKSAYETQNVGETKSFRVTRQDDCTFDYEGSVVKQLEQSAEVAIAGDGVTSKAKTIRGSTSTTTGYSAGPRKRHRVDVRKEDDGTNTVTVSEEEIKGGGPFQLSSGPEGISSVAGAFNSLDSIPSIPQSGKRIQVRPDIRVNDDGTYTGGYSQSTVQAVGADELSLSGDGIEVTAKAAKNLDSPPQNFFTADKRKRHSVSISANDDGTWDASGVEQTLKEITGKEVKVDASQSDYGVTVKSKIYKNTEEFEHGYNPGPRKRHSISLTANDDHTFDYTVVESESKKIENTYIEIKKDNEDDLGVNLSQHLYKGIEPDGDGKLSIPVDLKPKARLRHSVSASANDDGTVDYSILETGLFESKDYNLKIEDGDGDSDDWWYGQKVRVYVNKNKTVEDARIELNEALKRGPRINHSVSITANDDGTADYTVQEVEVPEVAEKYIVSEENKSKVIRYAERLDSEEETLIKGAISNQIVSVNQDGTLNYVAITKDLDNPVKLNQTYENKGFTTEFEQIIGTRIDEAPDNTVANEAEDLEISFRADEDGSLSWSSTKRAWNPLDQNAKGGTSLFKEVVEIGQNKKASEANSVIDVEAQDGEQIRVSAQIDERSGKVAYVKSTITANSSGQWEDTEDNNFIKRTITQERNADEPATLDGDVGRTRSQLNEYKKYDTIKEVLEVSENLSTFTESLAYQKKERRYMFTERTLSGDAKGWKELSSGEIRQKSTNRQWLFFGIHYVERTIDTTETIEYSINPLNAGSSANAPDEGEQQVTVEILPNGLYVKKTTTVTISEWDSEPTQIRRVNYVTGTGSEVVQKIEDDGETVRLEFGTTTTLGGNVEA